MSYYSGRSQLDSPLYLQSQHERYSTHSRKRKEHESPNDRWDRETRQKTHRVNIQTIQSLSDLSISQMEDVADQLLSLNPRMPMMNREKPNGSLLKAIKKVAGKRLSPLLIGRLLTKRKGGFDQEFKRVFYSRCPLGRIPYDIHVRLKQDCLRRRDFGFVKLINSRMKDIPLSQKCALQYREAEAPQQIFKVSQARSTVEQKPEKSGAIVPLPLISKPVAKSQLLQQPILNSPIFSSPPLHSPQQLNIQAPNPIGKKNFEKYIEKAKKQRDLNKIKELFLFIKNKKILTADLCRLFMDAFAHLENFNEVNSVYQSAIESGLMTPQLYTQFIKIADRLGYPAEAEAAFELACTEKKIETRIYIAFLCAANYDDFKLNDPIFKNRLQAIESIHSDIELYEKGMTLARDLNSFDLAQNIFHQVNKEKCLNSMMYELFIQIAGYTQNFEAAKDAFYRSQAEGIKSQKIYGVYLTVTVLAKDKAEEVRTVKLATQ